MTGFRGWHQRTIVILSSRGACRRTHRLPAAAESWPGLLHEAGDVVGDRLGVFDQVEIEIGDIVDAAEPGGARRRAETGMARRDDPETPRQAVEKRPVLRDIVAAMQKQ